MKAVISLLLFLTVFLSSTHAQEKAEPQRLIIGLDLSESNPLIANPPFAEKLALRVADEIMELPLRSEVLIRTFGDNDATANTVKIDEIVSARNKPGVIAEEVALLITNVPDLVEGGQLISQQNTNILAFLQMMHQSIGECKTHTRFILLSDGIEDSEYADLHNKGAKLPLITIKAPLDKRYKCDEFQILGIGQGLKTYEGIERLRSLWEEWATGDGRPFKKFSGLNDW